MKLFGLYGLAAAQMEMMNNIPKRDFTVYQGYGKKPIREGYYMQNGREKKLRDRDRFDGEDLDFSKDDQEFGVPDTFNNQTDYSLQSEGWDGWFENFDWKQYIEGDDEAERFFQMEQRLMNNRAPMTLKQRLEFRKFKMLKLMVMYLQQIPLFGKFCFYGCYCFPNLGSDFTVGKGKPVDDVDMKCRDFSSCYKCLAIDYKETCTHTQPYSFEGREDPVTKKRYLVCKNRPGTCRRSLCECDKKLAEDLGAAEWHWQPLYHKNWGGFDKQVYCRADTDGKAQLIENNDKDGTGDRTGEMDVEVIQKCCGKYPTRSPFQAVTPEGDERRCCEGKTFDPKFLQCCPNKTPKLPRLIKPLGSCQVRGK